MSILRSKKGSTLPISAGILIVGILMVAIIVDIGYAYLNRMKTQQICDAAVVSGANYAKMGYFSVADQGDSPIPPKRAIINGPEAEAKSRQIIDANSKNYPSGSFTLDSIEFNPSDLDPQAKTAKDQYYSGDLTIRLRGKSNTILTNFLDGFFKISAVSKAHASPD